MGELGSSRRNKTNKSTSIRGKGKKKKQPKKSQMDEDEDDGDDDEEWVVEAVEDEKSEGGRKKYLVRWEGYEELTWESEDSMENARGKIEEFRKKKQMLEREQHQSEEKSQENSEEENEAELYTVERILKMKVQNGQKSFLIKWER